MRPGCPGLQIVIVCCTVCQGHPESAEDILLAGKAQAEAAGAATADEDSSSWLVPKEAMLEVHRGPHLNPSPVSLVFSPFLWARAPMDIDAAQ